MLCILCISSADSTGTHSLYTTYQGYEVMFHVSTMLPYMPNNPQQVRVYKHPFLNPAPSHTCRPECLKPSFWCIQPRNTSMNVLSSPSKPFKVCLWL